MTSGYVERLIVMVPYTSLSTESCVIQVLVGRPPVLSMPMEISARPSP